MNRLRSQTRLFAWIAVTAILLGLLGPSWGQSLGGAGRASLLEVCSATGSKWVEGDAGKPQPPLGKHVLGHCLFCSLHAPVLGLPPAPVSDLLPVARAHRDFPLAFYAAPAPLHAWVSAGPRGPPRRA